MNNVSNNDIHLILCEDHPKYYQNLFRKKYHDENVIFRCVKISPFSFPKNIVNELEKYYRENDSLKQTKYIYYCVDFNSNSATQFGSKTMIEAMQAIETKYQITIRLIKTAPCFELWLWWHFDDYTGNNLSNEKKYKDEFSNSSYIAKNKDYINKKEFYDKNFINSARINADKYKTNQKFSQMPDLLEALTILR